MTTTEHSIPNYRGAIQAALELEPEAARTELKRLRSEMAACGRELRGPANDRPDTRESRDISLLIREADALVNTLNLRLLR